MFSEYSAFELPSQASCHAALTPSFSRYDGDGSRSRSRNISTRTSARDTTTETATRYRLSTKHHSVNITVDHEDGEMDVTSQPLLDCGGIPISGSCVGHSFLPLDLSDHDHEHEHRHEHCSDGDGGLDFYLEALVIKMNLEDGNVERSSHTAATNSSDHRIHTKDTLTHCSSATSLVAPSEGKNVNNNSTSSHGGVLSQIQMDEKKRDDSSSLVVNTNTSTAVLKKEECYILIRGYLPQFNQKDTSQDQHSLDLSTVEGNDNDNGNDNHAGSVTEDVNAQHVNLQREKKSSMHKKNLKRNRNRDHCWNVYQTSPVSYMPSSIELCRDKYSELKLVDDDDRCMDEGFILLVANDSEVKIYSMTISNLNLQQPLSATSGGGSSTPTTFQTVKIDESTLISLEENNNGEMKTPSMRTSTSTSTTGGNNMDFMSMLLEEASARSSTCNHTDANESLLTFPSPITAMRYMSAGALHHHLAVACQDGTIREVSFSPSTCSQKQNQLQNHGPPDDVKCFAVVAVSEFHVDGPVLSLAYSGGGNGGCDHERGRGRGRGENNNARIKLLAGSIHGFACYFLQKSDVSQGFEGPFPIIEGLWDAKISEDDAILSIHEFQYGGVHDGRVVALGLYSGRVLLLGSDSTPYEYTNTGSGADDPRSQLSTRYNCVWHCSLPYAVSGIGVAHSGLFPDLIICTKKSLHLFHSKPEDIAESTLERVEALLRKYSTKHNTIL